MAARLAEIIEEKMWNISDEFVDQMRFVFETEADRQKLKKENNSLKQKVEDLEHLLKLANSTSEKKEEEIKRLDDLRLSLQEELEGKKDDLEHHDRILRDYGARLSATELTVNRLINEKKDVEEHLTKLNSVLRSCLKLGNVTINESDIQFDDIVSSKDRHSNLLSTMLDTELLDPEFVRSAIIDRLASIESLSIERDDLKTSLESAEKSADLLRDTNRKLKQINKDLEESLRNMEREEKLMTHKLEDSSKEVKKFEENIKKLTNEKKELALRIENLESINKKLLREKDKLIVESRSEVREKTICIKEYQDEKERLENRIKKLEAIKVDSDSQIYKLNKINDELEAEKESLQQERNTLKEKVKDLQKTTERLNSALNESTLELKRCSDRVRDLEKEIATLIDKGHQRDSASVDAHKEVRRLREKIEELKSEKSNLRGAIETDRHSLIQNRETMSSLQMRVKQLEAELNLANLKRKEAEYQQTLLANGNVDKEAEIKELKTDITTLEERLKQLLLGQRTIEKTTYSVSSINRRNTNRIEEMRGSDKSFVDETKDATKGLLALEEKSFEFQRKVKNLKDLMDEATGSSGQGFSSDLRLKEAQKQAEHLLNQYSRRSPNPNHSSERILCRPEERQSFVVIDAEQTSSKLGHVSRGSDWQRSDRPLVTSTPIQRKNCT